MSIYSHKRNPNLMLFCLLFLLQNLAVPLVSQSPPKVVVFLNHSPFVNLKHPSPLTFSLGPTSKKTPQTHKQVNFHNGEFFCQRSKHFSFSPKRPVNKREGTGLFETPPHFCSEPLSSFSSPLGFKKENFHLFYWLQTPGWDSVQHSRWKTACKFCGVELMELN